MPCAANCAIGLEIRIGLEETDQACRRPSRRLREVAGQLRRREGGHLRIHLNGALALALIAEEEEKTILSVNHFWNRNGAADGPAELIAN